MDSLHVCCKLLHFSNGTRRVREPRDRNRTEPKVDAREALRLSDLRRRSELEQHARVEVSECMDTATRNFQSVE
jgi:hypothetical protein